MLGFRSARLAARSLHCSCTHPATLRAAGAATAGCWQRSLLGSRPPASSHSMAASQKQEAAPGMLIRLAAAIGAGEAAIGNKIAAMGLTPSRLGARQKLPSARGEHAAGAHTAAGAGQEAAADAPSTNRASGGTVAFYPTAHIGVSDEQGQRSYMEDRHTVIPDFKVKGAAAADELPRQFFAVYDGHSSARVSEHASRRVHEFIAAQPAIQQCQAARCDQAAIEEALKQAFEAADLEIVEEAVAKGQRYGTTAVCVLRIGNTIYVAHAGDSKAVLCRSGRAISLTRDHKPASVPEERQRIKAQGGRIAVGDDRVLSNPEGQRQSRLNMSRALGDPDFKEPRRLVEAEPDVSRLELKPGADALLLLGSDGLFDVMSAQQAVDSASQVISKHGAPSSTAAEAAADALVQQALQAGTSDNVTALVMLLDWAGQLLQQQQQAA